MGNTVKFPCGDDMITKKPYIYKPRKILLKELNLEDNPFEVTKKIVYLTDSPSFDCVEFRARKQILLDFSISLIEPEEITFDLFFKTKKVTFDDISQNEEQKIEVHLTKNKDFVNKYVDKKDTKRVICWGGMETILEESNINEKLILELYGQNYKKIDGLNHTNSAPYCLSDNNSKVYVEPSSLETFKKHIEKEILSKFCYHFIESTRVKIRGDEDVNMIFTFHVVNLKKEALCSKYKDLEISI